ncbi:MAG TPA: murein L,D-transpeptidase catalytic domain family protein [Vicinamibacterales bacterium]|nr:murein L,D-transpeptidase catalytic domain family protein [Vicinamibacterales bacterium]
MIRTTIFLCVAAVSLSAAAMAAPVELHSKHALAELTWLPANGPSAAVADMARQAASCAASAGDAARTSTLTIIDYSRPSTEPRLWVLDLARRRVLFTELVAHGRGSGELMATRFSNDEGSHASSLGLFVTGDPYQGAHGYSLRLRGLEPGVNDQAFDRAIVMHPAPYVDAAFAKSAGRLGLSWGCPALRPAIATQVIDTIKSGSLVFAYFPDQAWIGASKYLGSCAAASGTK